MVKTYGSADLMMEAMLSDVLTQGRSVSPREQGTLEYRGWTGTLDNPRARRMINPVRDARAGYPAAKVGWDLGLRNDLESIAWWNPHGARYSDDGKTMKGENYGQRMHTYLAEALTLLDDWDAESRRAWVPIWHPDDLVLQRLAVHDDASRHPLAMEYYSREGKNVPCTLGFSIWLESREKQNDTLSMEFVMRSQSVWGVFPYDLYWATVIQELCANSLDKRLGVLMWHCLSAHVYERELEHAREALHWYDRKRFVRGGAFNPQFHREMMAEDDEIELSLEEAYEIYPSTFDELTRRPTDHAIRLGHSDDPVVRAMAEGYEEITRVLQGTGSDSQ